ncbi:murein biosynthesis integral membrane protein MurJ [Tengunoibacter tsumagoiensis]|uniref:Putative lipid II flippase MurJ n=1 Tax=Tengunoibacter tsumagoiensis TaxID=2014871 RepID=A0A402A5E5_9CHLR|nr:lipid II flippase MurJ [Tengunoibacter tsumagoiensis]GCE14276.1 putative lipid II flippase MurJ [Tengunoibacter tsumagoiensis]
MSNDSIKAMQSSQNDEENTIEVIPIVSSGTSGEIERIVDVEETPTPIDVQAEQPNERRELVKSASLVMVGNLGSSVMGLVRQMVVAATGTTISAPFLAAFRPTQTFYDLLANGAVSGALIPTFNDYSAPEKRQELRRLVFTLVNLMVLIMGVAVIFFLFVSPWFVRTILVPGYDAKALQRTIHLSQIIFIALIGLGPFAILLAALYALKEFGWPAFATVAAHTGIILGVIIGSAIGLQQHGYLGLGFGVLIGTIGELALLLPGLRRQRLTYMFVLDLKHPALLKILKLYAPVAFSFLVSMIIVFLDQSLSSNTPCLSFIHGMSRASCSQANSAAKDFATTLIQFPVGLVAAALSFAILPTLTTHIREGRNEQFKDTLLLGFRLGLLLMIPAAAGLIVLQGPIIRLIFEHGSYTPQQAQLASIALQNYAYQLPFLAIDQLLISAFYARKNTIIPVTVGFVSVGGYLLVALPFWNTIGMPALVFANTVQNSSHAIILLILLRFAIGPLHMRKTLPAIGKILVATALMVLVAGALLAGMKQIAFLTSDTVFVNLILVVVAGGLGAATYFGGTMFLKVEEIHLLKGAIMAKLGKR